MVFFSSFDAVGEVTRINRNKSLKIHFWKFIKFPFEFYNLQHKIPSIQQCKLILISSQFFLSFQIIHTQKHELDDCNNIEHIFHYLIFFWCYWWNYMTLQCLCSEHICKMISTMHTFMSWCLFQYILLTVNVWSISQYWWKMSSSFWMSPVWIVWDVVSILLIFTIHVGVCYLDDF